ncbi:MAG: thiol:disulfide interchange protein, partial [Kiritimatiellia bacterium]
PAGLQGAFVIEGTLEPASMKPDQEFTATYLVTPQGDVVLGDHVPVGADSWPTVLPLFDKDAIWMDSVDVKRLNSGQMQIVMKGTAFEVEELREMTVGGLFQLTVDGKVMQTESTIPMPWHDSVIAAHAAKLELTPSEPAVVLGSPFVDDATCASMLGGSAADIEVDDSWMTVLFMLGGAFLGGLILNIMPCVLPVLTLKVYGLIEQKDEGAKNRIVQGVAYTAGILVSFLALAVAVLVVKVALGQNIGWGFQFQYPGYVATLAAIVFAFGLSLFGVFEIPVMGANAAAGAGSKEGPVGFFMTGVFATLLATPCSAPFLGSAMGFAFSQPPLVIVAFFMLVGLGLASPFLLIAFVPAMSKVLPPPGAWMDTFKQLMGFTLVATTMWLVYVLSAQVSLGATLGYVAFLAVLAVGCWIFGHFGGIASSMGRQLGAFAIAAVVVSVGGFFLLDFGSVTELSVLFEVPPLALGAVIVLLVTGAMVLFGVVPIPGLPVAEHGPSPAGTSMHVGGLALMGVAAALLFVFAPMTSPVATLGLVGFSATFTAGVWFVGHFSAGSTLWRVVGVISAVVVVGLGGWYFDVLNPAQASLEGHSTEGGIQWQDFNDDRMASVLGRYRDGETDVFYEGKTLFIDFTAEWCLSCKVNEKTIIQTQTVQDAMDELGVVPLKADWTNHNENITSWLGCYKRAGVPYYVVIPADPNQPAIALGEAVTTGSIVAGLRKGAGLQEAE